jgi:bifunctional DNA-binding transcriptional regulator/antitoxin component of YhaV-PrlF toxin-antitoxin module
MPRAFLSTDAQRALRVRTDVLSSGGHQASNCDPGNFDQGTYYISRGKRKVCLQWPSVPAGRAGAAMIDKAYAALQYCSMTALPISKRGTITLPPEFRQALGLRSAENPMMLAELRNGGVFLQPAAALPIRDIPLEQMKKWIAEDEREAKEFWQRAGKA